ncbi:MAG: hypothetical protein KAI21_09810, partial [Deltaproteobacteria bacterium]|nr:hypothetical protein [Deltaproteobacteria bacterium]
MQGKKVRLGHSRSGGVRCSILLSGWHKGEGLQQVAAAAGLLNLFWSTGVLESIKSQTPSTKLQTSLKFQYQMTKTGLEFGILVIVICLLFEICDLEFLVTTADFPMKE